MTALFPLSPSPSARHDTRLDPTQLAAWLAEAREALAAAKAKLEHPTEEDTE